MEFTFILPKETKQQTIKELLENEWLIPRKVKHFLRTRKNVLLNDVPAMFHATLVILLQNFIFFLEL